MNSHGEKCEMESWEGEKQIEIKEGEKSGVMGRQRHQYCFTREISFRFIYFVFNIKLLAYIGFAYPKNRKNLKCLIQFIKKMNKIIQLLTLF